MHIASYFADNTTILRNFQKLRYQSRQMEILSPANHSYSQQRMMDVSSYDANDLLCYRLIDSIDIETEASDFKSWKRKHPEMWTCDDIINWIYSVAVPMNINLEKLRGESFQGLSGLQLCRLTLEEFVERDQINGAQLFNCLHELLKQSQFIPPVDFCDIDDCCLDDIDDLQTFAQCQKLNLDKWECFSPLTQTLPSLHTFLDPFDDIGSFEENYSTLICPNLSPSPLDCDRERILPDPGYESGGSLASDPAISNDSSVVSPSSPILIGELHCGVSHQSAVTHSFDRSSTNARQKSLPPPLSLVGCMTPVGAFASSAADATVCGVSERPPKRKPGRPPKRTLSSSSSSNSSSSSDECCSPSPPKKTKKKNTHLWRFMRALLEDPCYNPSSIKWENKSEGVFRIVPGQSKIIARLWGQRKNNPSMTFDKMSRSLRWCRTYGFLSEVPKNGNYPKKLCFRFGDRALDWQI